MTQEHKQLLLQDLSTRLPFGVMLSTPNANNSLLALVKSKKYNTIIEYDDYCGNENDISEWKGGDVEFVKPYLRPMSSMTDKEKWEFIDATDGELRYSEVFDVIKPMDESEDYCASFVSYLKAIDWLNKNHFDYRGLIEKGLALEAPEGMYNVK